MEEDYQSKQGRINLDSFMSDSRAIQCYGRAYSDEPPWERIRHEC